MWEEEEEEEEVYTENINISFKNFDKLEIFFKKSTLKYEHSILQMCWI